MAILASGSFCESDFSRLAREAARDFHTRLARHESIVDLTRDAVLGLHPDVTMTRSLAGFERLRQIALFMSIAAALSELQRMHPGVGPFLVAPEPEAAQELTIVSHEVGLLGAIVLPCMSDSLPRHVAGAVRRLVRHRLTHRYVFFAPLHGRETAGNRVEKYERDDIQVWSLHV
jgi:hypothetical protein